MSADRGLSEMAQKYDLEMLLTKTLGIFESNLNTTIAAIQTEKNDGMVLATIDAAAFLFLELNGKAINYNPFFFLFIDGIESDGQGPASVSLVNMKAILCFADQGQDIAIGKRVLRYHRAVQETIEDNFAEIEGAVRLQVSSLVPDYLKLANSSQLFRAVGVDIKAGIMS